MQINKELLEKYFRYEPDSGKLYWIKNSNNGHKRIGDEAGTITPNGYRIVCIWNYYIMSHRIVWALQGLTVPNGYCIDHINGDKQDNRLANLRCTTITLNCRNQKLRKNNTSGHIGIYWKTDKKKWEATITVNRRKIWRQYFTDIHEAVSCRQFEAAKYGFHPNHGQRV